MKTLDRTTSQVIRQNRELEVQNQAKDEELDDIRDQIAIKQRAPESKKRASEARLD